MEKGVDEPFYQSLKLLDDILSAAYVKKAIGSRREIFFLALLLTLHISNILSTHDIIFYKKGKIVFIRVLTSSAL